MGGDTAVDFLLEHLKQLIDNQFPEIEIESVYEDVCSLRTFLIDSDKMSWHQHKELKDLMFRITDMANGAQDIIDSSIVSDIIKKNDLVYYISENLINTQIVSFTVTLDSVLEYMDRVERLLNYKEIYNQFSEVKKLQIKSLLKRVRSFRSFLEDSEMSLSKRMELNALAIRIRDVAKEAKDIVDLSIVRDVIENKDYCTFSHVYQSGMFINVLKELKSLNKEVSKIYENKLYGIIGDPHVVGMYSGSSSSSSSRADLPPNIVEEEETVVGFDNHVETIKERLAGVSKQLDVISIVGMPGLGKTTLTKKLYNDAFVVYHFYIRGWTYVSQVYAKRDLLLSILSSIVGQRDGRDNVNDEKLGEELYKSLKGKRYLIVMDDMWDIGAWDDMKIYFPNDNNGSRIIITSRLIEVALHAKPESPPHLLPLLTEDESWDLLKQKVFGKESCTPDLAEIGEKIAHKCQGITDFSQRQTKKRRSGRK